METAAQNWPTPQAHDRHGAKTPQQAQAVRDRSGGGVRNLNVEVRKWSTPAAHPPRYDGDYLNAAGGPAAPGEKCYNPSSGAKLQSDLELQARQWFTPRCDEHGQRNSRDSESALSPQAAKWSTPTVQDRNLGNGQMRPWGTPRGTEWKGTGPKGSKSHQHRLARHYLDAQVEQVEGKGSGYALNPEWEELLMGWPQGWTNHDAPCAGAWPGFPLSQGYDQRDYEPPRLVKTARGDGRAKRVEMLGNGVVPQCAEAAFVGLLQFILEAAHA